MLSILAGFMIGVGGTVYLTVGGPVGAFLFATGLFTIITFKLELFTGKAGLLATREISGRKLTEIWCGNFIGTMLAALGGSVGPNHVLLESKAAAIVQAKLANGTIENFIAAIFCGLLMYVAVSGFARNQNSFLIWMPVMTFILSGFNHCVADMFYLHLGCSSLLDYAVLVPITAGNIIGCNMLPYCINRGWLHPYEGSLRS